MDTLGDKQFELMESFHCLPTNPSPPFATSSWSVEGEEHCSSLDQIMSKEKRRGAEKRSGAGVRLSTDPQSVAARQRRQRISDRFRILKSLVPGGSKMDTVSMLEEAIHYVKFLKAQIWLHQAALMLPADNTNFHTNTSFTVPESAMTAGVCTNSGEAYADGGSSSCSRAQAVAPDEMMFYSIPAPTPTLPSFPYWSFEEEQEVLPPHGGSNY